MCTPSRVCNPPRAPSGFLLCTRILILERFAPSGFMLCTHILGLFCHSGFTLAFSVTFALSGLVLRIHILACFAPWDLVLRTPILGRFAPTYSVALLTWSCALHSRSRSLCSLRLCALHSHSWSLCSLRLYALHLHSWSLCTPGFCVLKKISVY